ncbi:MAG: recombination protein NinG [Candidatus Peribacteraceae bacterium]|nr:recombination protein NinG [Candidatus Peribacteraceae bacterium]
MKRITVTKLKKEIVPIHSRYIRLRDCLRTTGSPEYGECFTCDFSGPISYLQAGHFMQGRHNAYLFSERGVHAQCARCNLTLGGNPHEYRRQIVKLYGEDVAMELEAERQQVKKFTISELKELKESLLKKIRELE